MRDIYKKKSLSSCRISSSLFDQECPVVSGLSNLLPPRSLVHCAFVCAFCHLQVPRHDVPSLVHCLPLLRLSSTVNVHPLVIASSSSLHITCPKHLSIIIISSSDMCTTQNTHLLPFVFVSPSLYRRKPNIYPPSPLSRLHFLKIPSSFWRM